jgi:phosphonate dehydrogenase
VPDLLTIPTAELTHGLMIALGRNILSSDRHLRVRAASTAGSRGSTGPASTDPPWESSAWAPWAKRVAKRLLGYDSEVIYHDRRMLDAATATRLRVRYAALSDLLRTSDFIACILPLNIGHTTLRQCHRRGAG